MLQSRSNAKQKRSRKQKIKKLLSRVLLIFLIQFAAVELLLVAYSGASSDVETEYLLILGAGLDG